MINLNPAIIAQLRVARRTAKLSQSVLAAEVGCKQSALSMFEQGDGTKLNDEVVERLAKRFGISLTPSSDEKPNESIIGPALQRTDNHRGYCPNPHCPTNHRYEVEGRVMALPNRAEADPVGGKFCAFCGELLEKHCSNCGAPVHEGGVCSFCGEPYVQILS